MPIHGALTGGELTALQGAHVARWFLSVVNSSSVATARINQSSFTYPIPQLTVNATSGNWSSVGAGMTFAVGSAAGLADKGLYRVRSTGDATTIKCGETSQGDPGLMTMAIRNAGFANADYITIYLTRRDIWSIIPRIIAASGSIFEDYDKAVGSSNTTPECILNITMNSTDRRAGFCDAGQTYRTIQFDATETLWPTSSSIASRLWTAPAGWGAPTAGSTTGASVTYQVPRSAENYEIQYQATDNNGIVTTAYRQIWASDRSGATVPLTVTSVDSLSWDRDGMKATISLNDVGLASIPIGAMVILWCEATWGGSDITSAPTQFVGWIVRQTEVTEPGLRSVQLEIVGPAGLLALRGAYSQFFDKAASPSTWQQLPSTLEFVDFLVWWLARQRAANVLQCFNYTRLGMSNLTGRLPQWRIEAAGNLLAQMRSVANSYSANVGCNPDGELVVRQHPNRIAYSLRSGLATRATLTASIYHDQQVNRSLYGEVRRVRGEGFYWDGAATLPTPKLSDAPGDAPGQGTRDERLQNQTVDNQSYLNTLTGLVYADLNNPLGDISVNIQGNWGVFYPAEYQLASDSIPSNLHPSGVAQSIRTIPRSVSLRRNEDGTLDTALSLEGETSGVDGVTVPVPTQATSNPPYVPPIVSNPLPAIQIPATHTGGTVIALEKARIGIGGITGGPWTNITGSGLGGNFLQLALDPFSDFLGAPQSGNLGAWCVTTTGLFYTSNILTTSPIWVVKNTLSPGVLDALIRPSTTSPGVIYVAWENVSQATGPVYVAKLTAYGSAMGWSTSLGDFQFPNSFGFDIDHYGSDECLVSACTTGLPARIWRIVSGSATLLRAYSDEDIIEVIQKPLFTFGGSSNSSIGGSENFIYHSRKYGWWKTTDGGTNFTSITPAGWTLMQDANNKISSVEAVDNASVMAAVIATGGLFTSSTGGSSWTSRGGSASRTVGYFPRLMSGQYALYLASATNLYFSPDFGASITDITGSWATDIGAITYFNSIIPLY